MICRLLCLLLPLVALAGCVTAPAAGVPDHAPRYDYWENGGGACCPYHAQQFQAARAAKRS